MTSKPQRTIYRVSELNTMVRELLAQSFGLLWIEGEISNLARPRSGHVYFSLKDDAGQVRCALFRNKARYVKFAAAAGDQVLVRARVGLYAPRGDYQLIVEHMEPAGAGALQRAFELLKARLEAEGLFAAARKQAIPAIPQRIGVITSATGAALRDVLSVLSRRYPLGAVRVYPVAVQGTAAPAAIVRALQLADRRRDCDVLLVTRGGGSLEDLQAFNDETVARAIAACSLPIIAGVGHEVDITIADFVADMRAPTPSAAAELVCPDLSVWLRQLDSCQQRLNSHFQRQREALRQQCATLYKRLGRQHPRQRLQEDAQRIDELETRLTRATSQALERSRDRHILLQARLQRTSPQPLLRQHETQQTALSRRLQQAMTTALNNARQRTHGAARALHTASPLQTLERGYSIARDADDRVISDATAVSAGAAIAVVLRRGQLQCRVEGVDASHDPLQPATQDSKA